VPAYRLALLGLVIAVAALAACGSGDASASGTHIEVDGVATAGTSLVPPDPTDANPSIPDPSDALEVDISGSVSCNGTPTGTGMFASNAIQVCNDLATRGEMLDEIARDDEQECAEVYGGPQHASISGSVAGTSVDVSIDRSDSCGIQSWQSLEWLLGPPER
jgi:hypothetical protein